VRVMIAMAAVVAARRGGRNGWASTSCRPPPPGGPGVVERPKNNRFCEQVSVACGEQLAR
jgi:hypothetical protein